MNCILGELNLELATWHRNKSIIIGKEYDALVAGVSRILEAGRNQSAWTLNSIMSAVYWEIGRRIVQFEQSGKERADYGERVIDQLSLDLRKRYGRGFGRSSAFQIRAFYLAYREKVQTVSGQLALLLIGLATCLHAPNLHV